MKNNLENYTTLALILMCCIYLFLYTIVWLWAFGFGAVMFVAGYELFFNQYGNFTIFAKLAGIMFWIGSTFLFVALIGTTFLFFIHMYKSLTKKE